MRQADDSGQWLLLIAVIVAIGMAVLMVFVNQSVLAGHSSSASIMDFPKNDIREIRAETTNEAMVIGNVSNAVGSNIGGRKSCFQDNFSVFADDIGYVYSTRGAIVDVRYDLKYNTTDATLHPDTAKLDNVTIDIYYNNGDTRYNETTTVFFV